jgi:adenine deaminase
MDYDSVIKLRERITAIIDAGRRHGVVLDGHCMFLTGKPLNAYISTGIEACHENFTRGCGLETEGWYGLREDSKLEVDVTPLPWLY